MKWKCSGDASWAGCWPYAGTATSLSSLWETRDTKQEHRWRCRRDQLVGSVLMNTQEKYPLGSSVENNRKEIREHIPPLRNVRLRRTKSKANHPAKDTMPQAAHRTTRPLPLLPLLAPKGGPLTAHCRRPNTEAQCARRPHHAPCPPRRGREAPPRLPALEQRGRPDALPRHAGGEPGADGPHLAIRAVGEQLRAQQVQLGVLVRHAQLQRSRRDHELPRGQGFDVGLPGQFGAPRAGVDGLLINGAYPLHVSLVARAISTLFSSGRLGIAFDLLNVARVAAEAVSDGALPTYLMTFSISSLSTVSSCAIDVTAFSSSRLLSSNVLCMSFTELLSSQTLFSLRSSPFVQVEMPAWTSFVTAYCSAVGGFLWGGLWHAVHFSLAVDDLTFLRLKGFVWVVRLAAAAAAERAAAPVSRRPGGELTAPTRDCDADGVRGVAIEDFGRRGTTQEGFRPAKANVTAKAVLGGWVAGAGAQPNGGGDDWIVAAPSAVRKSCHVSAGGSGATRWREQMDGFSPILSGRDATGWRVAAPPACEPPNGEERRYGDITEGEPALQVAEGAGAAPGL